MLRFNEYQNIINSRLEKIAYNPQPKELYEPIKYLLSIGGKRIRPSLLLMTYNLFSESIEKAINPAIGIELFHNFTLMHDDLIDNSELRRKNFTVHAKWDANTAILSGDAMLIKSYEYILNIDPSFIKQVFETFNNSALKVCEGQQMDILFENAFDVKLNDYLKMISLKTAALIACSVKIGAIIGKADKNDINNLNEFGENIGIAFQLQDDLLDVYGNIEDFGKNKGGDILLNKKTFLLIKALNISNNKTKKKLLNWINKTNYDKNDKIKAVIDIYNELNIKILTHNEINKYFDNAMQSLHKISVLDEKKLILKELISSIKNRTN